jgi:cysteinyl-tRNA synthetase
MKPSILSFIFLFLITTDSFSQDLASVRNWGYQLSEIDPKEIKQSNFDLIVIDYSKDGSDDEAFTPSEVELMKSKTDGSRKILLAYLSIGEAEDYRFYWNKKWKSSPPFWLGKENEEWGGNYKVHYWDKEWQNLIYGTPDSYLDKIMAQGFDGVYLDIIDAFEYYQDSIPEAQNWMAQFVADISIYAKTKSGRPFYIVGQNGETLVDNKIYLDAIDAVGKEDLYFGMEEEEQENPENEIEFSLNYLRKAKTNGKKIFLVEYIHKHHELVKVSHWAKQEGFIPLFAQRDLEHLTYCPSPSEQSKEDSLLINRLTPGKFYSVVLPKGMLRIQLASQFYTERYNYSRPFNEDIDIDYYGRNYYEFTNYTSLHYGLGKHWETGFNIPIATSHLYSDRKDSLLNPDKPINHTGIGCVELYLNHGKSWNNYKDNFLIEFLVGLPTDNRKNPFNPGSYGRVAFTREHYKRKMGIIAVIAGNYYTQRNYTGWYLTPEVNVGIGMQINDRFFLSTMLVQEMQYTRVEMNLEKVLNKRYSLEANFGAGIINPNQTFYASLLLNYLSKKK